MRKTTSECKSLDYLVNRLRKKNRYFHIEKNVPYYSQRWNGELDVYTMVHEGPRTYFHYYERKAIITPRTLDDAYEQIQRWMVYMNRYKKIPLDQLKGVIYSEHYVKRVRPR